MFLPVVCICLTATLSAGVTVTSKVIFLILTAITTETTREYGAINQDPLGSGCQLQKQNIS